MSPRNIVGITTLTVGLGMVVGAFLIYFLANLPDDKAGMLFWMGFVGMWVAYVGYDAVDD